MSPEKYLTNYSTRDELRESWQRLSDPCPIHGQTIDESFCCWVCEEENFSEEFYGQTYGSSLGG